MSKIIPTRLSKVAKELNVGLNTIKEYFGNNSIHIDVKPNTKIDNKIYELLFQEFKSEKETKEKSNKQIEELTKRESIISDNKKDKKNLVEEDEFSIRRVSIDSSSIMEDYKINSITQSGLENDTDTEKLGKEKPIEIKSSQQKGSLKIIKKIELPKKYKKEKETTNETSAPKIDIDKVKKEDTLPAEKEEIIKTISVDKSEYQNRPKVLRTIEIKKPLPKEPKPVASSTTKELENNKKKRKRINPLKSNQDTKSKTSFNKFQKGKKKSTAKKESLPELDQKEIQKEIQRTLQKLEGSGKSKSSKHRKIKREEDAEKREIELIQKSEDKKVLRVTEYVTVHELSNMMDVSVNEIIKTCMSLGLMVAINQRLDAETLSVVVDEFGYKIDFSDKDIEDVEIEDDEKYLQEKPPVVTIMGHVDHGKTSLLDYLRNTNVISGEAGGITQHIGAYNVSIKDNKTITFLDTPGHEAFTAMRARGAKITDIVVVVISADDSVMPQTKEAINHAQVAGVPIIFALNKIDKQGANPDKIREELSAMNILVEEWGGKYQCQEISAKKGTGIKELLEKILLEAEFLELKANPNRNAIGTIIESSLDKGRGYVTNILIQKGTLKIHDLIVSGANFGRVKAMFNIKGVNVKTVGPAMPVSILGFNRAPIVGDRFKVYDDEREAKQIANKKEQLLREQGVRSKKHITLDEIGRRIAIGDFQELNLIVKADVNGSAEALADTFLKLSTEKIQVKVIYKSIGQITENDVLLASASNAIIIGFQVRPSSSARKLAEKEEIQIKIYSIIYNAINELRDAMKGMLKAKIEEKIVCTVEIKETFKISKIGTIAGCNVTEGKINRNTKIRLIRDGIVIYTGMLGSLKRFKDDVKEVSAGYECGLNIKQFNDIKVGDIIEGFEEVEIEQEL